MRIFSIFLMSILFTSCVSKTQSFDRSGFTDIKKHIANVEVDLRYFGNHNFVGRPIRGYHKEVAILSTKATLALKQVQNELNEQGIGLKIFDAYRPQKSVRDFEKWARRIKDTIAKQEFYPDVDKKDLFKLGYIASKSGHTRGSTIDLTLIDSATKIELDMGSSFDFFGTISHHATAAITKEQKKNRELLRNTMLKYGFKEYSEEWWHYTLKEEPFPNTYFDFNIE